MFLTDTSRKTQWGHQRQMRSVCFSIELGVSALFAPVQSSAESLINPRAKSGETVVLLHGLGLGAWAMKRMEWALECDGYRVINVSYLSRTVPVKELAESWLPALLDRSEVAEADKLHFVTHSMGGIILRGFLRDPQRWPRNIGRVVMIAPPNSGSELVDRIRRWWLFRAFTGVNGRVLGTDEAAFPLSLGGWKAPADLGVIAGDRSLNLFARGLFPGPHDGKVSVRSTYLDGMREHRVVHSSHTWLQYRRRVINDVRTFLKTGHFSPVQDESRIVSPSSN